MNHQLLVLSSLRYSLHHPWQFGLSLLGIALGVAVVVAVDLSNQSAQRAFELSTEAVMGTTTHQILGGPSGLDDALYGELRVGAGLRGAKPVVEGRVLLPGDRAFTLLGVDPIAEAVSGSRLIGGVAGGLRLDRLVAEPATVVLSAATAHQIGVGIDDSLIVRAAGRSHEVTVVGLLRPRETLDEHGTADLIIADIATAQELLERVGKLSRIDLVVPEGETEAVEDIRRRLPPGATLATAAARGDVATEMTRAFNLNLVMLSLLALVVGMFLIYNTMTFSVVQRRSHIGTLRALGVTRTQIFATVLGEALVLGAAGTMFGIVLGIVLAHGLVQLVSQTINDLYYTVRVRELTITPGVLAKGVALGLGAALTAASFPAWEATRVAPRAALARSDLEMRVGRIVPRAALLGFAVLVVGGGFLVAPGDELWLGFAGLFALVLGATLIAPAATRWLVGLLERPAGAFSKVLGLMAVRGVAASLSRTAVAIAALMVALAATVGVAVMVASFRQSVAVWLDTVLRADAYVTFAEMDGGATLDPATVEQFRSLPALAEMSSGRRMTVQSPHGPVALAARTLAPSSYSGVPLLAGEPDRVWSAFEEHEGVLVTEPYAYRHDLQVDDAVELVTDRGSRAFRIAGIFRDYGSERGGILMSRVTFDRYWDNRGVSSLGLYAAPEVAATTLVAEAAAVVRAAEQDLTVRPNRAIRDASLDVFDRTFTITTVLRILATLVAFVGTLSALMALELERAREIALLRALGLTPPQVWGLVQAQTGVIGLVAGLLAIPLGLALAAVLILVINRRSFGWGLDIYVDPMILLQAVAWGVAAALLAGIYPAVKMARMSPAAALRGD